MWAGIPEWKLALALAVGQVADSCSEAVQLAGKRLPRLQVECTPSWAVLVADILALVV